MYKRDHYCMATNLKGLKNSRIAQKSSVSKFRSQCNVNVDIRSYNGRFLQVLEAGYAWNQMLKEAMLS